MHRRLLTSSLAAGAFLIATAGTALGAHCVNESQKDGAGEHGIVIVNAQTGEASFVGLNPGGKLPGGFADVWLDTDGDGDGDVQIEEGIFLAANHSHKANPGQGSPAVLPPVLGGRDPGGDGRGVGVH